MKKIESFFLNKILYKKVYDEFDDNIGKLWDVYVITKDDLPKAIGYKLKKNGEILNYEFKSIDFYEGRKGKISIKIKGAREIIPRTYSYLLSEHLLDKQIVDINGKKLVKVNDLRMVKIAGQLKVVAVDTGIVAFARRIGLEPFVKKMFSIFGKKPEDSLIIWDNLEYLDMDDNSLKLSIPYKKLIKLHPADVADILEEMDTNHRKKIFETIDEDLAADILEEVEPKIQADILENLSECKMFEVLDSMPNDEIVDMLEEVDDKTKEKVFLNLEKDDEEEVKFLMGYEQEVVGSIMNKDFISFNINITIEETIELLRDIKPEDESIYYIYIVDEEEKLQGVISLRDLIVAPVYKKLLDIMDKETMKINDNQSIDDAVEMAIKYDLLSIPVVNEEDKLCGIVVINDIIEDVLAPTWKKTFKKVV